MEEDRKGSRSHHIRGKTWRDTWEHMGERLLVGRWQEKDESRVAPLIREKEDVVLTNSKDGVVSDFSTINSPRTGSLYHGHNAPLDSGRRRLKVTSPSAD